MKSYAVAAISVVATAAVGLTGFWLGQHPVLPTKSDTPSAPDAGQQGPVGTNRWTMETQFEGPLKDTVVQRWRDPSAGVICYIYLPVVVPHSQPLQNGMVHYDNNPTGSISCVAEHKN